MMFDISTINPNVKLELCGPQLNAKTQTCHVATDHHQRTRSKGSKGPSRPDIDVCIALYSYININKSYI